MEPFDTLYRRDLDVNTVHSFFQKSFLLLTHRLEQIISTSTVILILRKEELLICHPNSVLTASGILGLGNRSYFCVLSQGLSLRPSKSKPISPSISSNKNNVWLSLSELPSHSLCVLGLSLTIIHLHSHWQDLFFFFFFLHVRFAKYLQKSVCKYNSLVF